MSDTRRNAQAVDDEAAAWLARQDGEAWDGARQREFDAWLDADTRHRVAYLRLRAAWTRADALHGRHAAAAPRPALPRFSRWRVAAGIVLAVALGAPLAWLAPGRTVRELATAVGENRTVALADGSRVTLNTDSRLRADASRPRTVRLERGEAYFDIAHDAAHPFVVEAGDSRVTVLGTRFTVRREGDAVRVLVAQGRVRLAGGGGAVELARNEEATARAGAIVRTAHSEAQTAQRLAWREGRIVFDGTSLAAAAAEFNRYNERRIVVADPAAARIAIGGSFAPTNVDGFVRLLEQGFGLHARRQGKDIVISR